MASPALPSWSSSPTREAIVRFVDTVTHGTNAVPLEDRIAVFDNDGTLWPEKPMPVQVHFIVEQWRAQAASDSSLAEAEPYRSTREGDYRWLAQALEKHAVGDDADLRILIGAIAHASDRLSVTDYAASVAEFMSVAHHPTLYRPYAQTAYQPMVELLRFLEDNGFTCYIVSGGDRDFMRPIVEQCYGIPPERVIGSALGLRYDNAIGNGPNTQGLFQRKP